MADVVREEPKETVAIDERDKTPRSNNTGLIVGLIILLIILFLVFVKNPFSGDGGGTNIEVNTLAPTTGQ